MTIKADRGFFVTYHPVSGDIEILTSIVGVDASFGDAVIPVTRREAEDIRLDFPRYGVDPQDRKIKDRQPRGKSPRG